MKKLLIGLVIVIACAAGYWTYAGRGEPEVAPEPVALELQSDYEIVETVPSVLQPMTERYLSVRTGGKLEDILVQPGQQVAAGNTLAVVDKAKRVADLERAFSNHRLAKTDMNRIDNLHRRGAATRQEWDDAKNRLSISKTELKNAKQDLEDSVVRTPIDGILSFFAFRIGDYVPDGSRVAVVEDRSQLRAISKVPYDMAQVMPESITVSVKAYDPIAGRGVGEATVAAARVKILGITSDYDAGKRDVEFQFAPLPEFSVGQAVMISFTAKTYPQVAIVPTEILLQQDGKDVLVLETPEGLQYQRVTVISSTADTTVIEPLRMAGDVIKPTTAVKKKLAQAKARSKAG